MKKELSLFRNLFEDFPNISIVHIANCTDFINPCLEDLATSLQGSVEYIKFTTNSKLRLTPRSYEYAILSDVFKENSSIKGLLKTIYNSLENSANIIILEKKLNNNLDKIKELIDETGFVAINNIELFPNYNLVTAKKLHMWGNGL